MAEVKYEEPDDAVRLDSALSATSDREWLVGGDVLSA